MVLSPLAVAVIAEQEEEAAPASAPLTAALLGTLDLVTSAEPAPGAQLLWLGDPGKVLTVLTELLTRPRWLQSEDCRVSNARNTLSLPPDWAAFSRAMVSTLHATLAQAAAALLLQTTFDKLLWMSFFRLAAALAVSPLPETDAPTSAAPDPRLSAAQLLADTWRSCPEQLQLVPALVGPLLELVLSPRRDIRQVSCDWWRAGHVITMLTSGWSGGGAGAAGHDGGGAAPPRQLQADGDRADRQARHARQRDQRGRGVRRGSMSNIQKYMFS